MLPLNVLPERHLEQSQSHVERLDDVALPGQRVVPPGGLSPWHLTLRNCWNIFRTFSVERFNG